MKEVNDNNYRNNILFSEDSFLVDIFGESSEYLSIDSMREIFKGYFGSISISRLKELIAEYETYSTPVIESNFVRKREFVEGMRDLFGLKSNRQVAIKLARGSIGASTVKSHNLHIGITFELISKFYYNLKKYCNENNVERDRFEKARDIISAARYTKFLDKEGSNTATPLLYSLADLYAEYIQDDSFALSDFSEILYRNKAKTEKGAKTKLANKLIFNKEISSTEYFEIEFQIDTLISSENGVSIDKEKLKKFKKEAIALMRWHYLIKGLIKPEAMHASSILLDTAHVIRRTRFDNNKGIFRELAPSRDHAIFRGETILGSQIALKLRHLLESRQDLTPREKSYKYNALSLLSSYDVDSEIRASLVGKYTHSIALYKACMHLNDMGINVFYEIPSTPGGAVYGKFAETHPDQAIIRDSHFKAKIERHQSYIELADTIKRIVLDFTMTSDIQFIFRKLEKQYQNKEQHLIIVLYGDSNYYTSIKQEVEQRADELVRESGDISQSYVSVLTLEEYLELIQLEKTSQFYNDFMNKNTGLRARALAAIRQESEFEDLYKDARVAEERLKQYNIDWRAYNNYLGF